jgi:hypothetical protein
MTFNWPDIPFTGAEVEAFVDAYKAFAQEVLDSYDTEFSESNEIGYVGLPYMSKTNMKIYLENALLYSAFIIKQKAGNSGPGTDFQLGNSPLNTPLNDGEQDKLLKKMGCTVAGLTLCFGAGDDADDAILGPPCIPGVIPCRTPPELEDVADEASDGDEPHCPKYRSNYNGGGPKATNNGQTPDRSLLWKAYVQTLKVLGLGGLVAGEAAIYTSALLLEHYFNASGSTFTSAGIANGALGVQIRQYMNKHYIQKVNKINPSPAQRSAYSMLETDNLYSVDFYSQLWLAGAFGGALVVTDGTETITQIPGFTIAENFNYIKSIIDDYDFNYAWTIIRANTPNPLPGTPFDNSQIESGPSLCPTDGSPPKTVCGALTGDGHHNLQYAVRLPVAEAHGDGCREYSENDKNETGKPFPVLITFSRTAGNGL